MFDVGFAQRLPDHIVDLMMTSHPISAVELND